MALDRESIVRRDFPTHRRGYDTGAVDAHLDAVATEVDALRRRASEPATLSAQAGEQVRSIIQAAERGAQEIREAADAQAREHIARVTEAADRLRARIEQMESDVTQLILDLRTDAERLHGDLSALQAGTSDLREAEPGAGADPPAGATPADAEAQPGAGAEPAAAEPDAPTPADAAAAQSGEVANAAARIVALDMALSGKPREEADRYLAEHYDLADRERLLDEVYAAAG
jgi:DivIVA domain-containing protein